MDSYVTEISYWNGFSNCLLQCLMNKGLDTVKLESTRQVLICSHLLSVVEHLFFSINFKFHVKFCIQNNLLAC